MNKIKQNLPNLYILIVAVAIAMWFQGVNFIINRYVPPTVINGLILCIVSLLIFYMDDQSLSELYNYKPEKQDNLLRHGAPAIGMNFKN